MTERDAFHRQAASDWLVFRFLVQANRISVPACHPLHYLQMSSEKLAKAAMLALGQLPDTSTHVAFSRLPILLARRDIARRLGWSSGRAFRQFLKTASPIFREIDELHPSVGTQNATAVVRGQTNVEYPWKANNVNGRLDWHVPAEHQWTLVNRLRSGQGAQVLRFLELLLDNFNEIFPGAHR